MASLTDKYKPIFKEILPNTKRTLEIAERRREQERKQKMQQEQALKAQKEQQFQLQQLMQQQEQEKLEAQRKRKEEERKKQEEKEQISTLRGRFGHMINNLKTQNTTLDYTISGIDLMPAQVRILVKAVEKNNTLKGLVFPRKNIVDNEGIEIANNLKNNQILERMELEGNQIGPKTLKKIAELLLINSTLRTIDLEGNDLTYEGKDTSGIEDLAKSLCENTTLLCLNLSNTKLNEKCSEALEQMLEVNTSLICLDIDRNPKMKLESVRRIQEALKRNKKTYDDQRYKEFYERKKMWNEENISEILHTQVEGKRMAQEHINMRVEALRQQKQEDWEKEIEAKEILRQKEIQKLEKEAALRKTKKRKKRK